MMNSYDKIRAIRQLADPGEDHEEIRDDILALIDKLVSPKPAPTSLYSKMEAAPPPNAPRTTLVDTGRLVVVQSQPISPTLDELMLCRAVGKIPAIKAYRARTGASLKQAKERIEDAMTCVGWNCSNPGKDRPYLFENVNGPVSYGAMPQEDCTDMPF